MNDIYYLELLMGVQVSIEIWVKIQGTVHP